MAFTFSSDQEAAFHRDGYVTVPGMFEAQEVSLLNRAMEECPSIHDHVLVRPDQ
ncbi:MAG: hypothetical protein R8L07_20630 [Alphaproteobacteria bacterium]|nr:hypothetical protein [Alphaproteobacteria bacterium]